MKLHSKNKQNHLTDGFSSSLRLKLVLFLAVVGYGAVLLSNYASLQHDEASDLDSRNGQQPFHPNNNIRHKSSTAQQRRRLKNLQQQTSSSKQTKRRRRRRLLPSQVISQIGERGPAGLWKNRHNVVHVINTRFLQHQSKLVHLNAARLDLFETFTLPSIQKQTNNDFLWLLWTTKSQDDDTLQTKLIQLLKAVPNAVLIDGVQDKNGTFRSLYGHAWSQLSGHHVLHGNHPLLADYYRASQTHLTLETRLDADDALSHHFVESIQAQAAAALGGTGSHHHAEFYCPASHVEWRYYSGEEEDQATTGKLVQFDNDKFCIFSGLTWAYPPNHPKKSQSTSSSSHHHRALQQVANNNGNNCPGDEVVNCNDNRRLNQLLLETVEIDEPDSSRRRRELWGGPCHTYDVACYQCGNEHLECFVNDHGMDAQPVLDWLTTLGPAYSGAFCEVDFAGAVQGHTTCAGQQCTGSDNGFQAFALSDVAPAGTCPVIGQALCPHSQQLLTNFAIYQVEHCQDGYIGLQTCPHAAPAGGVCTTGTCLCEHGYMDYCSGCPPPDGDGDDDDDNEEILGGECRRQLQLLRDDEDLFVETAAPAASVLLARTPTAAGMKNVLPHRKGGRSHTSSNALDWDAVALEFGVGTTAVSQLRQRFEANMEHILIDAFAGQCSPGHSCKESTQRALAQLLNQVQQQQQPSGQE